jgi:hypothetical protein
MTLPGKAVDDKAQLVHRLSSWSCINVSMDDALVVRGLQSVRDLNREVQQKEE